MKINQKKFSLYQIIVSSSIGNVLEFYDFATYGFLMPVMAPLFFPSTNPVNSLLLACGVFAVSFVVRPLGGIIFGYIGDTSGRKMAFSLSLILMASATTLIGFLPTYETVGLLSPLMLIVLRLIQGLCLGGEFSGSLIFANEHTKSLTSRSALISGCISAAGVSGWFLSSITCSLCLNLDLPIYSWRIPFVLGAFVGIIGYYIRCTLPDSPVDLKVTTDIWKALKENFIIVAAIAGIGSLMGGIFYGFHIFPNSFLPIHFSSISQATALHCTTFGIGIYMAFLPLMGWIADCIGYTKVMKLCSLLTIIFSYPILLLLMSGSIPSILLAEFSASFMLAGFMAPATYIMTQHFVPSIRYRLVSFSYNLGACLIGGGAPFIFMILIENLKSLYAPAIYIISCGIIGWCSSYCLSKKSIALPTLKIKASHLPSYWIFILSVNF